MKFLNTLLRIIGATVVLVLLQVLPGIVSRTLPGMKDVPLVFLSNLLVVGVLAFIALSARQHGWKLAGAVFLLFVGVSYINTLDEALFFKVGVPPGKALQWMASGLGVALVFAPLLVLILGRWDSRPGEAASTFRSLSPGGWVWRLAVGDVAYILLYFIAGIIVFPFVKDFYATIVLPSGQQVLLMQVFRGLIYIGVALPIVRMLAGKRGRAALALGLAFSVLGGIAPLLLPNPYMPANVRLAHTIEIGISNFIFGAILAYLFTPKLPGDARAALSPEAARAA